MAKYYFIHVNLRDNKQQLRIPQINDEQDAKDQLGKIREVIGTMEDPGLDWMAALGTDIASAHIEEKHPPSLPRSG